ncbi:hypothetical protein [Lactiplantibacillus xiangfangensis]
MITPYQVPEYNFST